MGLISKPYTFTSGTVIVAAEHNSNYDTVYNCVNGNIENSNINAAAAIDYNKLALTNSLVNSDINSAAAIADTKLATITTASKVNVSAITGTLPIANGGTGQATAPLAINALMPDQTSANGKYITSNGSVVSWGSVTIPTIKQVIFGAGNSSVGDYYPLVGGNGFASESEGDRTYFPVAGTLKNMYCSTTGNTTVTLYKSGVGATALSVEMTGITNASDTTHTVSISAGDYVYIRNGIAGAKITWAIEFDPS